MKQLAVPREILTQHVAVLGKTRSGKSSVMRGLVEDLLERQLPVCIVDPKGDWWGIKLAKDGQHPGFPVVIFGGEHADVPINEHAGAHVAELFATGNRPCLIDLGGWMPGARTKFWIDFASTLFRLTKGDRWLAIDEVHNFCPKGRVFDVDAGKALHWTNRLASEGLGKGLALIVASQRPQKVHNDTLTSCETLIAMRVIHPSDREAIADWIKGCGDSSGAEVLKGVANLDRGEGWVWSPEINFGPQRVKFPLFQTYDSFRAQTAEDAQQLTGWAEVDLDEVRRKLDTVVKEAAANDPTELKKEIARLRGELVRVEKVVPELAAPAPPVEVPVFTEADRAALVALGGEIRDLYNRVLTVHTDGMDTVTDAINRHLTRVRETAADVAFGLTKRLEAASALMQKIQAIGVAAPAPYVRPPGRIYAGDTRLLEQNRTSTPPAPAPQPAPPVAPPAEGLTGSQQKILNTIMALRVRGITPSPVVVAKWMAMHPRGGRYLGDVRLLKKEGYLDDAMQLTHRGQAYATPAATGLQAIKAIVPGSAWAIVETLYRWEHPMRVEDLAAELKLHPRGGRFLGDVRLLRTLGVVPAKGDLTLTEAAFR